MSAAAAVDEAARARLAPGVVLRQDKARGTWTLQGPERVLVLDDTALAVVRAAVPTKGAPGSGPTVAEAVDALAAEFDAPRADIVGDVLELLGDMRDRGFVSVG